MISGSFVLFFRQLLIFGIVCLILLSTIILLIYLDPDLRDYGIKMLEMITKQN